MCCTRLAENTGRKNSQSAHHRTTLSGYISTTKPFIDNRKNLLNSSISSACTHDTVNFGPLTAEIGWRVWPHQQISTGFVSWLCYCSDNCARCLAISWAGTLYIHFQGRLPPNVILPGAKFTLYPSLGILLYWQRYCTTLEQWASAKFCSMVSARDRAMIRHWAVELCS